MHTHTINGTQLQLCAAAGCRVWAKHTGEHVAECQGVFVCCVLRCVQRVGESQPLARVVV